MEDNMTDEERRDKQTNETRLMNLKKCVDYSLHVQTLHKNLEVGKNMV